MVKKSKQRKAEADTPRFPYTDQQLKRAGLLGDDVSQRVKDTLETMRKHPDLLNLSLFALQCMDQVTKKEERDRLAAEAAEAAKVDRLSKLSTTTDGGPYSISEYERETYYTGISPYPPPLLYRSDLLSNPFPLPPHVLTKSMHGVFNTPLKDVWETVGSQICDLLEGRGIKFSIVHLLRFCAEDEEGYLTRGPVVIWIGVLPGSTAPEEAYKASGEVLSILERNRVGDVVLEWTESVTRRLMDVQ